MKKLLVICLTILITICMSISVFAAGGFISSPSGNLAPDVVSFKPADEDCTARLVITPYAEREELPEFHEKMLQKAFEQVLSTKDLTTLNADFSKTAADKKIKTENLAVSDLFDIHVTGCDVHEGHVDFDITLAADTLSHFVGLLHMKQDGVWELVKDAKVTKNGEHLEFSVESFSPFAIVVETENVETPKTGDSAMIGVCAVVMFVSAVSLIVITRKSKKV